MEQKFIIKGMTCENCKKDVEKKIAVLVGVKAIEVDLKSGVTKINALKTISLSQISEALGSKYSVLKNNERLNSTWKSLFPLALIFIYITIGSFYLQREDFSYLGFMTNFMGLFFISFSFFKFLNYKSFPGSFKVYDPIAKAFPFYSWLYPFIEVFLGIFFLLQFQLNIILWVSLLILSFTTFGVLISLRKKDKIQCACLGTALNLPMTKVTLIENLVMISMSVFMLIN